MKAVDWRDVVASDPTKAAKADLWKGTRLFAGLNCLLPGQAQDPHAHPGADKFYLVLEGRGVFEVGDGRFEAAEGELVPAPAGVTHGVRNTGPGRLVVLTVIAPPPGKE